jgi:hypothetical protein
MRRGDAPFCLSVTTGYPRPMFVNERHERRLTPFWEIVLDPPESAAAALVGDPTPARVVCRDGVEPVASWVDGRCLGK